MVELFQLLLSVLFFTLRWKIYSSVYRTTRKTIAEKLMWVKKIKKFLHLSFFAFCRIISLKNWYSQFGDMPQAALCKRSSTCRAADGNYIIRLSCCSVSYCCCSVFQIWMRSFVWKKFCVAVTYLCKCSLLLLTPTAVGLLFLLLAYVTAVCDWRAFRLNFIYCLS